MSNPAHLGTSILKVLDARFPTFNSAGPLRTEILALNSAVSPSRSQLEHIATEVVAHIRLFSGASADQQLAEIERSLEGALPLVPRGESIPIVGEESVEVARDRAGALAKKLGFKATQMTRVVTAASELARNIVRYAAPGEITLGVVTRPQRGLSISARDQGPGIPNLTEVMAGQVRSKLGMGMGLRGVKALANEFKIDAPAGKGTTVEVVFFAGASIG